MTAGLLKCVVPWPACPSCHLGMVMPVDDAGWACTCGHRWQGPPVGAPCGREPTHVAIQDGSSALMCDAHAVLANRLLPDAKISKLTIERKEFDL